MNLVYSRKGKKSSVDEALGRREDGTRRYWGHWSEVGHGQPSGLQHRAENLFGVQ
jgi:hypothetical protein